MPRPRRSTSKNMLWLLVEWPDSSLKVVSARKVIQGTDLKFKDLTTGKLVTVTRNNGDLISVKIVMSSHDRRFLELQAQTMTIQRNEEETPGLSSPQIYQDDIPQQTNAQRCDVSTSASSWAADEWNSDSSVEVVPPKRLRNERVTRNYETRLLDRSTPTPTPTPTTSRQQRAQAASSSNIVRPRFALDDHASLFNLQVSPEPPRRVFMYDQAVQIDLDIPGPRRPTRDEVNDLRAEVRSCIELLQNARIALRQLEPTALVTNVLNSVTNIKRNADRQANLPKFRIPVQRAESLLRDVQEYYRDKRNKPSSQYLQVQASLAAASRCLNRDTVHDDDLPHMDSFNGSAVQRVANLQRTRSYRSTQDSRMAENLIPTQSQSINVDIDESEIRPSTSTAANTPQGNMMAIRNNIKIISTSSSSTTDTTVESDEGMVPIGSGATSVPRSIYESIDWNSHTIATRKLLKAVFPRTVLATHSLTGKASPAFQNKPAKQSLDPEKVADIVKTVSKMCHVKDNLVRNAITVKCADENKMFKQKSKGKGKSSCKKTPPRDTFVFTDEDSEDNCENQGP